MSRQRSASPSWAALILVFAVGAACRGSDADSETGSSALTAGSADSCDKTPIDNFGTLPACAAGHATRTRPGTPDDHSGPVGTSLLLNASEKAAKAIADQLAAERHPPGVDPVDLGFPPIPLGARVNPKVGPQ